MRDNGDNGVLLITFFKAVSSRSKISNLAQIKLKCSAWLEIIKNSSYLSQFTSMSSTKWFRLMILKQSAIFSISKNPSLNEKIHVSIPAISTITCMKYETVMGTFNSQRREVFQRHVR